MFHRKHLVAAGQPRRTAIDDLDVAGRLARDICVSVGIEISRDHALTEQAPCPATLDARRILRQHLNRAGETDRRPESNAKNPGPLLSRHGRKRVRDHDITKAITIDVIRDRGLAEGREVGVGGSRH